jgi:hypothetical protein
VSEERRREGERECVLVAVLYQMPAVSAVLQVHVIKNFWNVVVVLAIIAACLMAVSCSLLLSHELHLFPGE